MLAHFDEVRRKQKLLKGEDSLCNVARPAGGNGNQPAFVLARDDVISRRLCVWNWLALFRPEPHAYAAVGTPMATIIVPPVAKHLGEEIQRPSRSVAIRY